MQVEVPGDGEAVGNSKEVADRFAYDCRVLRKLSCFGGVILAAYFFFLNWAFYEDDSLITLRYCRNLLDGHGLIWNVGERVEGYTNFLYLILVAGLGALHIDLEVASRIVGGTAYLGIIVTVFLYATSNRQMRDSVLAMFPVVLVMTSCSVIVWSLGGLEAPLCAVLATAGVAIVALNLTEANPAPLAWAGIFFGLAAMTRIDAVLFLPAAVVFILFFGKMRRDFTGAFKIIAAFGIVYLPYFIWRLWYYGDFFPNTFYAKGTTTTVDSFIEGFNYVIAVLLRPPSLGVWIVGVLLVVRKRALISRRFMYLMTSAASYSLFPIFAGGDHMAAGRFMVPAIPVLALALYEGLLLTSLEYNLKRARAVSILLLITCVAQGSFKSLNPIYADSAEYLGRRVGEYIKRNWPAGALVSINAAGVVPYLAKDQIFIDMLGLNDRHIAHQIAPNYTLTKTKLPGHRKGDGEYVLERRPDFIIFGPPEGTLVEQPWYVSDYEISLRREVFDRLYVKEEVEIDMTPYPYYDRYVASQTGKLRFVFYRKVPASL